MEKDLPSSGRMFPDGCHYRIEVSGIETPAILEAVVDEAKLQGIPIHRAIATVNGSVHYSDEQLKELAEIAARNRIEVIICPGNLARGLIENPNNLFTMMNYQNTREARDYYKEVLRCVELGFRGFLALRKGMLNFLAIQRKKGRLPKETIFKLSTFDNNANILDFTVAWALGADTINCTNNLSLENLSEIRQNSLTVMDIHMTFWQLGFEKNKNGRLELVAIPYDRIKDAPELARLCSPCCFKFEAGTPGIGVYDLSNPDKWGEKDLAEHKRRDVQVAAQVVRAVKEKYQGLKLSDWGPKDLRIPQVK